MSGGKSRSDASSAREDSLAIVAVAIIACTVYHGALGYFFSQDDFAWLAHGSGLLPPLTGPWRWLSHQGYFQLMWRLFGPHALPYHVVSLAAHAACAVLVFVLARRLVSPPAALIGAAFFAAHPAHYTAVYWISAVSTLLAGAFAWAALVAVTSPGARPWGAIPLFAASLGCKESNLLLPASAALRARRLEPVALVLAAMSLAFWIVTRGARGVGVSLGEGSAYGLDFGAGLLANLGTYIGWTVNFTLPTIRRFSDAVEPGLFAAGAAATAAWLAGLLMPALRRRGWLWSGLTFLLLLAPVLPLAHHTYRYYLYAPVGAAALLLAALADGALTRVGRATAWTIAALAAALFAWNGYAVVRKVETHTLPIAGLHADATVDRALIAETVYRDLATAQLPPRARLYFWWGPSARRYHDALRSAGAAPADTVESYEESNVRAALVDGLAIRVLIPAVDSIAFVQAPPAAAEGTRVVLYDATGRSRVLTPATLDSLLRLP